MKLNSFDRIVLVLATMFLGLIALRPLFVPEVAKAQTQSPAAQMYIEPGVHFIHAPDNSLNLLGKIVVDVNTGNIWGFPTYADSVYPVNTELGKVTPPISTPIFLGRYDFSAMAGAHRMASTR